MNVISPNGPKPKRPYRASRAKRGTENICESQRAEHEQVILLGLNPPCAKRIIPSMSPALSPCAKKDQDLLATRSEARRARIVQGA